MATAFTLPALAVAAQAVAQRWRRFTPVVGVLLLSAVPANMGKFGEGTSRRFFDNEKQIMLGAAYSPLADRVSPDLQPHTELFGAPLVTIGFLIAARNAGRLPSQPSLTLLKRDEIVVRLGVEQLDAAPANHVNCRRYTNTLVLHPTKGAVYVIKQPVAFTYRPRGGIVADGAVVFDPSRGKSLVIQLPGLELHVAHAPAGFLRSSVVRPFTFCE